MKTPRLTKRQWKIAGGIILGLAVAGVTYYAVRQIQKSHAKNKQKKARKKD